MLVVCRHCHRHVRHSESVCPFCGTSVSSETTAYGVGLAVALTVAAAIGCSDDNNGGNSTPPYGPAPLGGTAAQGGNSNSSGSATQGGTSQTSTKGAGGGMVTLYAGPPTGGSTAARDTSGIGGIGIPLYGAPPAPPGANPRG